MKRAQYSVLSSSGWWISLGLASLVGCAASHLSGVHVDLPTKEGLALQVLDSSFIDGAAAKFTITTQQTTDELIASVRVSDAAGLKALYFILSYDSQTLCAISAESTGLLNSKPDSSGESSPSAASSSQPVCIQLAKLEQPGVVYYGEVLPGFPRRGGFSGDGVLATVRFACRPFFVRESSAPPVTDASQAESHWDPQARMLTWYYSCQGDYDQNGMVTINDLTPLGRVFGMIGPFDPLQAISVVDGNQDGVITINDITPIGQNFQRGVEGYNVFASLNPVDLPTENNQPPGLAPLDFVPFAQHLGDPQTDRLGFSREYPALDPYMILWVRPVSETLSGTPSTTQQPTTGSWRLSNISEYASLSASLNHNSLAVIAGLPAVVYEAAGEQQLVYQSALDLSGAQWSGETVVSSSNNLHTSVSLAEVLGFPALVHHDFSTGELEFIRATDPAGIAWGTPQTLDNTGSTGWDSHMLVVNGNPAVCYLDLPGMCVKYVRALDPAGAAWGAPVNVADLGSSEQVAGEYTAMTIAGGNPAICYHDPAIHSLRYVRATDANGGDWGAASTLDAGADVGRYSSMALITGNPAISYLDDSGLAFIRASDAQGIEWTTSVHVDTRFGAYDNLDTSLCTVADKPAISYYSGLDSADLLFVQALDNAGAFWGTPQTVDSRESVGRSASLATLNGNPLIAYLDETSAQARFATRLEGTNLPPVAVLSAEPTVAALSETITFDASRSYDPDGTIEIFEWDFDGDGAFEFSSGATPVASQAFDQNRVYNVSVRVTDPSSTSAVARTSVIIGTPGLPPQADLQATPQSADPSQTITFDASASVDLDGSIALYEWDCNCDGVYETSTGAIPTLTYEYAIAGIYNPGVKVTDSSGLVDHWWVSVNVGMLNQVPVAVLTANPLTGGNPPFTVYADGSGSYDLDGTIVLYEWDFDGDGVFEISGGTYAMWQWLCEQYGEWRIKLRVTDNSGAKDTAWIKGETNKPPVARVSANPKFGTAPLSVAYDGSTSADLDGSISSYSWDLFDDGQIDAKGFGTPQIWNCQLIWAGSVKVRLKVTDNKGASGSAVATVNVDKGWHLYTLDSAGATGLFPNLALVNGKPAVAYLEFYSQMLKFIRAGDATGSYWGSPVNIAVIGQNAANLYITRNVRMYPMNSTTPAIAFCGYIKTGGGYLGESYVLAKDSAGSSWNTPIVAVPGGVQMGIALGQVAGKAALVSHRDFSVWFVPAKNATGSAWGQAVKAASSFVPLEDTADLVVVNGNPAILYSDAALKQPSGVYDVLKYVRATDAAGTSWSTPVVVDASQEWHSGEYVYKLAVINGRPAVAYRVKLTIPTSTSGVVRYKRADDANGSSWTATPVELAIGVSLVYGLITANGCPAVCFTTCANYDVMYIQALDANGASWPAQSQLVDNRDTNTGPGLGSNGGGGTMIAINGHPAISYINGVTWDLMYAYWE